MNRRLIALLTLALLFDAAGVASAAGTDPLRAKGVDEPLGNERLSNETTLSRWAHTNVIAPIRAKASKESKTIGKLRWNTEDGLPEVYLVLASSVDDGGRAWLEIRVPGRPNGRTGWVPEEALGRLYVVDTQLIIDRGKLRARLLRRGKEVWSSPIGVGAPGTPTPRGRFWIRERLSNLAGRPIYGPWAFGTSAYSDQLTDWPGGGVVGVHGTDQPELIPGRPSHGCVRVPNAKIRQLKRLMPIGTPVLIK